MINSLRALIIPNLPFAGNACNVLGYLKAELNLYWCGLYIVMPDGDLALGPFQGLPACTNIKLGRGVCGTAAAERKTMIVEDVSLFPGYIACHAEVKSEIVVPAFRNGELIFVLDVDSDLPAVFTKENAALYEQVAVMLAEIF